MAQQKKKRVRTEHTAQINFVHLCAFLALMATAILLLVGPIIQWILQNTNSMVILRALNMIAQFCMLVAIALPAWYFVRGKSKGWKIAYWVFLAIYIAATILGVCVKF